MRDGRQKNSARVLIETSNLPALLVVVDVGGTTTVVTMTTVLLASCVVVWDREPTTSGVVDGTVGVLEVWEVDIELVVVGIGFDWMVVKGVEEGVVKVVVVESAHISSRTFSTKSSSGGWHTRDEHWIIVTDNWWAQIHKVLVVLQPTTNAASSAHDMAHFGRSFKVSGGCADVNMLWFNRQRTLMNDRYRRWGYMNILICICGKKWWSWQIISTRL